MSYELGFLEEALKEWRKFDGSIRAQFKEKLAERLDRAARESARTRRAAERAEGSVQEKLRSAGFQLVYEVRDRQLIVVVVAVGKPRKSAPASGACTFDSECNATQKCVDKKCSVDKKE